MVHQLSLVSSVSHGNYVQTISTLQALTGLLTPQAISTYTLVTKPHNVFKPKFEPGKVNQIEQFYMKCITTWNDETGEAFDMAKPITKGENDDIKVSRLFSGDDRRTWTTQIADIPIAGKNQVCSAQTVYESTLVHHHTKVMDEEVKVKHESDMEIDQNDEKKDENNQKPDTEQGTKEEDNDVQENASEKQSNGDATAAAMKEVVVLSRRDSFLQFLEDLGYDVINQFWMKGVRFFHGDIVIEIFKVLIRDDEQETSEEKIKLKLLDESNTFQIRAYINVPKSTDVDLINQGTKDLLKLQEFLKNLLKLEIPDRMFMDSRVNYK